VINIGDLSITYVVVVVYMYSVIYSNEQSKSLVTISIQRERAFACGDDDVPSAEMQLTFLISQAPSWVVSLLEMRIVRSG